MKKKGIQESNFTFSKDHTGAFVAHKTRMPIIKCVCGFEILVVPDLKAMSSAIKNHVAEHKQADYGLAFDSLEEFLTEQILMAAAK
jgi:hypothetical protein